MQFNDKNRIEPFKIPYDSKIYDYSESENEIHHLQQLWTPSLNKIKSSDELILTRFYLNLVKVCSSSAIVCFLHVLY